ncbi:MAG: ATP-dependent DNA helicase RecG [Syntrophomonadaceae bacterium]|nr:ATP-dependent DNA helicase RecG [Syntrophomonadaceae bacterium]
MDRLLASVQFLKGIGPKRSKQLNRLGVETVFDLLWLIPRSYFNRGNLTRISGLKSANTVNIRAVVQAVQANRSRRGMQIFKALLNDGSGQVTAVWFNQPFLKNIITPGKELFISGRVNNSYGKIEINVSEYEIMDKSSLDCKILPVYPLTEGLNQNLLRSLMLSTLQGYLPFYPEILNEELRRQYELCDIYTAFRNIHFPSGREGYLQARKRLALEELLLFQISLCLEEKLPQDAANCKVHQEKNDLVIRVMNNLPFQLTDGQTKAINEIYHDMGSLSNMNRLLQGDVGSGKTVVAALAMAKAVASGFQAAIMAPTEILAEQHFNSINNLFKGTEIVTARLTGGTSTAERRMILEATERGEINIVVGTHALIQETVKFSDLGLVVIDEQHRFGVRQRAMLTEKGTMPDILVMTATPIPRTLALTVYGKLDLSIIDELPPGRKPVITRYIKQSARKQAYNFIHKEVRKQMQVYVVCPLVEESENQDLQAAVSLYEELRDNIFPDIKVGLLHGRMKSAEKGYIMNLFKKGIIQILVTTTVIEVGVDVPNASIMVIEHAERFGLSQLHQLRGRVGRGKQQAYCLLIGNPHTEEALKRLQVMESTCDGFKLAQEDLLIRGPGDFWGVRQHGLHQLKVADLTRDHKIIELSRQLVLRIKPIENLKNYVNLKFNKSDKIAPN